MPVSCCAVASSALQDTRPDGSPLSRIRIKANCHPTRAPDRSAFRRGSMAATRAVTAVLRPSARFLWPVPATDGVRTVGPMWAVERLRSGPDLTRAHLAAGAWDEAARPHMGTAALTYLLPRSSPLVYRDGCGNKRMVRPGDAAVSVAGRGLACRWRASPAAMLAPAVPGGKHRDAVAPEVPHDGDAVAVDAVRLRMVLPPSDERCVVCVLPAVPRGGGR